MRAKEADDARIEVAVKGGPVETGRVGANARDGGGELRRAGRQECEVAGRDDMNVRLARQALGNAHGARRPPASASQFGSPVLKGDFMAAKLSCVKVSLGTSAITAAWIRASCGGLGAASPL